MLAVHTHISTTNIENGITNPVGHSYLELTNVTGDDLFLWGLKVQNRESITIGYWSGISFDGDGDNTNDPPQGVYFNRESFYYSHLETVNNDITALVPIDSSYLSTITNIINVYQHTNYNLLMKNCAHFVNDIMIATTGVSYIDTNGGYPVTPHSMYEFIYANTIPHLLNFPIGSANEFYGFGSSNGYLAKYSF